MSGHVRFGFAAFLVVAGFATPAAANAITDLFSPSSAPEAASPAPAPAPAAAPDDCLRQPGPATAGQHWVYRYDGHRKCWFQAAASTALAKKFVRHHVARHSVAAPEEIEPAPRSQKAVEDARAELVKPAPAETPQPTPSEPKLTVVRTIPVHLADAAALVPPAPVLATPGVDQSTSDQPTPRQVDVEKLLADAPAASDEVATAPPATPVAAPTAMKGGGEQGTASWLGVLLIALGGAALLTSSRTLRRALSSVRFPSSGTEPPVVLHDGGNDLSFASERIRFAGARRDDLLRYDPQSVAPLMHAARTRRTEAPGQPAQEAFWEEGIGALAALASPVSPEVSPGRRAMAYRGVEQRGRASGS